MKYADGREMEPGDIVAIDVIHRGTVVASVDTGRSLAGYEDWAYLKEGVMINTSFGGLVHYTATSTDELVLLERPAL